MDKSIKDKDKFPRFRYTCNIQQCYKNPVKDEQFCKDHIHYKNNRDRNGVTNWKNVNLSGW